MTTFNAAILITADATVARRELKAAEASIQALGPAGKSAGTTAASGLKMVEAEVAQLRRANVGVTSNLVAQFNDVGQMLAAGQSPLLLAAQQGTQISQALGQAGAAGSVRMLGQAFLGMLAPTNLAVFATIAGLGLLSNSLRGLIGEEKSVEDAFGDLEAATKGWREAASVGVDDLAREFGAVTPEIVEMQRQLTQLKLTETLLSAADAAKAVADTIKDGRFLPGSGKEKQVADLLNTDTLVPGSISKLSPDVAEFLGLLDQLKTSDSLQVQIDALTRMREMIEQSSGGIKKMTDEQHAFANQTVDLEQRLRAAQAAEEGIGSAQQIAQDRAERMLATLQDEANVRRQATLYGQDSREAAEARVAAERRVFEATLATLDVSDSMKGSLRDAWDAANGLQGSAAEVVQALFDAAGAGEETQRAIRDAWDLLTGAADATNVWASAMSGVAAEVRGIGAALGSLGAAGLKNASKQIELDALQAGKSASEARRAAQEAEFRRNAEVNEATVGHLLANAKLEQDLHGLQLDADLEAAHKLAGERDRLATRSARAASASRKTDGALRLEASLQRELDILRETDPVQKEMIRNREVLAKASDEERAAIERLIAAKIRETEKQKQAEELWDFTKNTAYDAIDALIIQGEKASDVMANLASAIAKALLQSALLGTGPLAGLFGGQGTGLLNILGGGLLGGGDLFSNIGGWAEGGLISGPGGPRDDKVLTWLSNGEYVVNAAATTRHRPLLEAINAAPRFADGGIVGGGSGFGTGSPAGGPIVIDLRLTDDLDARVAETSRDVSLRVFRGGIAEYDAKMLPRRVQQIGVDPRKIG